MAPVKEKNISDSAKRGYSEEEIAHIYELGRLCLEIGNLNRAEIIFAGLNEVAADYAPAWLGMSYINIINKNYDQAIICAENARRNAEQNSNEAMLYLAACLLTTGDYNSAGTYLGEVSDKIQNGQEDNPNCLRFFKAQMARYTQRE